MNLTHRLTLALILTAFFSLHALGQSAATATLRGNVTLGDTGRPVHNALITILQLKRTVGTDKDGQYEFRDVPPGR